MLVPHFPLALRPLRPESADKSPQVKKLRNQKKAADLQKRIDKERVSGAYDPTGKYFLIVGELGRESGAEAADAIDFALYAVDQVEWLVIDAALARADADDAAMVRN